VQYPGFHEGRLLEEKDKKSLVLFTENLVFPCWSNFDQIKSISKHMAQPCRQWD